LAPKIYGLKNNLEEIIKIKGLNKESICKNNISLELLVELLEKDSLLEFEQDK